MDINNKIIGRGWAFPPTFRKASSSVEMASGKQEIEESLHILFTTHVGERILNHKYGCNLDDLLFEPLNTTLETYVKDLIQTAILYFEPRIILHKIELQPVYNEGKIEIMLEYTIAGTNNRFNYVYPYYKSEGTEL
jgi:phage baseplate assembly protein W